MRKDMLKRTVSLLLCLLLVMPTAIFAAGTVDETYLTQLNSRVTEIEGLIADCNAAGISADYERVTLQTMKRFVTRMREDMEDSDLSGFPQTRITYNKQVLEEMYLEAKANLLAYLDGTKQSESVPRYVTGTVTPQGRSMIGTAVADGVTEENRPLFFTGYGHFGEATAEIPNFQELGSNIVATEIGPNMVITGRTPLPMWTVSNNGFGGSLSLSDVAHGGAKSAKLSGAAAETNKRVVFSRTVRVKPNTKYVCELYAKAEGIPSGSHAFRFSAVNLWQDYIYLTNSSGWVKYSNEYTTGADQTRMTFIMTCEGEGTAWVDDITLKQKGRSENLLLNGDFEAEGEYAIDYSSIYNLQDVLASAEEHDIRMTVLISPHYFPQFLIDEDPTLKYTGSAFIQFNIKHPTARAVIKQFLDILLPEIGGYESLGDICLTNEPMYQVSYVEEFYREEWEAYLEEAHGTLAALNTAYGTSYKAFSEVPMPQAVETIGSDGRFMGASDDQSPQSYDFMEFNNRMFAEFHVFLRDCVKANLPDMPVHAKQFMPVYPSEWTTWRNAVFYGTSPDMFAEFSDIAGNDATGPLGGGNRTGTDEFYKDTNAYSKILWYDLLRSTNEAPIYNSEEHFMWDNSDYYGPLEAVKVYTDLWMGAVHGRVMSSIWLWEIHRDPAGTFSDSISTRADCVKVVGDANLDMNRLAYEVTAFQNEEAEVALFYSETARSYSMTHMQYVYQAYAALLGSGQKVDIMTDRRLLKLSAEELNRYKVLVLPDMKHLSEEMLAKLEGYTGRLVIAGPNETADGESIMALDGWRLYYSGANNAAKVYLQKEETPDGTGHALQLESNQNAVLDNTFVGFIQNSFTPKADTYYRVKMDIKADYLDRLFLATGYGHAYQVVLGTKRNDGTDYTNEGTAGMWGRYIDPGKWVTYEEDLQLYHSAVSTIGFNFGAYMNAENCYIDNFEIYELDGYGGKVVSENLVVNGDFESGSEYQSLCRDEHDRPFDTERIAALYKRAAVVNTAKLQSGLRRVLADEGLMTVQLVDSEGNLVSNVEWTSVEHEGKTLVNICSYDWDNDREWNAETMMKVIINGETMTVGEELLRDRSYGADGIAIQPYQPVLLSFDTVSEGNIRLFVNGAEDAPLAAGTVRAEATLPAEAENTLLCIGLFEGGLLKKVAVAEGAQSAELTLTETELLGNTEVKAFLWQDMKPLAAAKTR